MFIIYQINCNLFSILFFNPYVTQWYYILIEYLNTFQENLIYLLILTSLALPTILNVLCLQNILALWSINKIPQVEETLLVGFYNTHPSILYGGLIFFFCNFFFYTQFNTWTKKIIMLLCLLAFILGGYWGLGNSVWGYYWVNDIIELILLGFSVLIITLIHLFQRIRMQVMYILLYISLFIILINLRLGLLQSRHTFFDLSTQQNWIIYFSILSIKTNYFLLFGLLFLFFYVSCYWVMLKLTFYLITQNVFFKSLYLHICLFVLLGLWVKTFKFNYSFFPKYWVTTIDNIFFNSISRVTANTISFVNVQLNILVTTINYFFFIKYNNFSVIIINFIILIFFLSILFFKKW